MAEPAPPKFVGVLATHSQLEAEQALDLLAEAGIAARTSGGSASSLAGAFAPAGFCDLCVEVPEEHVAQARELLAHLSPDPAAPANAPAPWPEDVPAETSDDALPSGPVAERSHDAVWPPLLGLTAVHVVLVALAWSDPARRLAELGALVGWPDPDQLFRLVTYGLLHFGPGHLLANTATLLVGGWACVRLFGLGRSALAYTLAIVAAGLASASLLGTAFVVGSSGGVFALLTMVLAGRARLATRIEGPRGREWIRLGGFALLALPSAAFFNWAAHLTGVAVGLLAGLLCDLAPLERSPTADRFDRRGRVFALAALLLLGLPPLASATRFAVRERHPSDSAEQARLRALCDAGQPQACTALGTEPLLRRACTRGDLPGCQLLAVLRSEPAPEEARTLFEKTCAAGDPEGCAGLARLLASGRGGAADPSRATGLYRSACSAQVGRACLELGRMLEGSASREPLTSACELGEVEACLAAGRLSGPDPGRARELFARGCDEGDRLACTELGTLLEAAGQDLEAAREAYRTACAAQTPTACLKLGVLWEEGRGGERSFEKARPLYELACERDLPEACLRLGGLYQNGQGVPRDDEAAERHFRRACGMGHPAACALLPPP